MKQKASKPSTKMASTKKSTKNSKTTSKTTSKKTSSLSSTSTPQRPAASLALGADHVAARLVRRLWDGHSGARSRAGVELWPIVDAAIALADAGGLDAVSMRAVALAVDVPAMTLYSHVGGKAELIDLMQDRVWRDLYDAPPPGGPEHWRAGLWLVAEKNRAVFRRHPWLLRLGGRPVLGPHTCTKYEHELAPLDGTGLSDVDNDASLSLVLSHVTGTAWAAFAGREVQAATAQDDQQWWRAVAPVLDEKMDPRDFPRSGRVGAAAAAAYGGVFSDDHAFSFGLERILDGIWLLMRASAR